MTSAADHQASLSLVNIYEISKILTSAMSLGDQLRAVLNLLASYMDMRRGIVAVVDGEGEMRVVAAAGLSADAVNDGVADMPREIAERIMAGQAPFVTEDVAEDPLLREYVRVQNVLDDETVSFIAVPIKTFGKPFGCLAIARIWNETTTVNFGEDIRFLTMVANLIAQSVRLHNQLQPSAGAGAGLADDPAPLLRHRSLNGENYRISGVIGAGPNQRSLSIVCGQGCSPETLPILGRRL